MKSIFKYTLEPKESNLIEMPSNSEILSVDTQGDNVVIYALVSENLGETEVYDFRTYGTGHLIETDLSDYKFLDTAKLHNGQLMFHIFFNKQ